MAENPRAADRQHRVPTTASGEAWRRAEQLSEQLAETGDTTHSFIVTGLIGTAVLLAIAAGAVWLLFVLVRWLLS